MTDTIMTPLLPCHAIDPMLEFYQALGFTVTYQQSKPNNYAVVALGSFELHFFTMPKYVPADSYSTCYARVSDVAALYQAFTAGLRAKLGRVPTAGIPRVIPLKVKTGRREFILVDPGGNWIRIGQPLADPTAGDAALPADASPLGRALGAARLLSENKGDDAAAAQRLDAALVKAATEGAPAADRFRALVFRAGLAVTLGEAAAARTRLAEARALPLTAADHTALADELQRAADLESELGEA